MSENRVLLYDSTDSFCNDIIQEFKNNNLLKNTTLVDKNIINPNNTATYSSFVNRFNII